MALKGSAAVLKISLHGQTLVNISGTLRGLSGFDISEVEDSRPIPGGGVQIGSQLLGYKEGSSSFTVDENATTAPVFWGRFGRRFDVEWDPEGLGTGTPKHTFEAIADISHAWEARGVRRFSVTLNHDGLIARATN